VRIFRLWFYKNLTFLLMIRFPVIASSLTSTLLVTALPAAVMVVVRVVVVVGNAP
jgi:hypothetical protein